MAISGLGSLAHAGVQLCKEEKNVSKRMEASTVKALNITDTLVGITLIVVGLLAMFNIIPIPVGAVQTFVWGSIGFGLANLLASFHASYKGTKDSLSSCCTKEAGAANVSVTTTQTEKLISA